MLSHTSDSKNFKALHNARSIKDIEKVLTSISSDIQKMKEKPFQISLSAGEDAIVREAGDLLGSVKTGSRSNPFNAEFEGKVKIPKSVLVDADEVNRIQSFIAELEAAKVVALSGDFSKLNSTKALIPAIDASILDARKLVKLKFQTMFEAGKERIPDLHKKAVVSLVKHLNKVLDKSRYSDITRASYVVPDKQLVSRNLLTRSKAGSNVLFQTYVKVKDLVDENDFAYDEFYMVLSSRLEGTRLSFYLTSLKSKRIPGTFPIGERIETPASLRKHVNAFLSVDSFVGQLERKPIQTPESHIKKPLKSVEGVSGVRVSGDTILVQFSGLSPNELKKAQQETISSLYSILKVRGRATLQHKTVVGSRNGTHVMKVTMGPTEKPNKLEMTRRKAKILGDALGLDNAQMKAMLGSI